MNKHLIDPAARIQGVEEYYFASKLREIRQMNLTGETVINLGIGSPDLPPAAAAIEVLQEQALLPENHGYQPYNGVPELRKAIANWYKRYYSVELDPDREVLPLFGSKEGLMHIAMAFLGPGDHALVPDPGYPAYAAVTRLAGAKVKTYPLLPENDWLPDLDYIELMGYEKAKVMWINYPHMPTGKKGSRELFRQLVQYARANNILLVNDNPYSFILNEEPISLLETEGAMNISLELNSLSKSHNMAGWRIGVVAGRQEYLDYLVRFKSQMDSGMFKPMQLAAAAALEAGPEWYEELNKIYRERREVVYELLDTLECTYSRDQCGLFVWARIPQGEESGRDLSERILQDQRVFLTPGFIFGPQGDQFIRVSLCQNVTTIREALARIQSEL
ncbi:MAG: aminotransferase class I/II-fold pyridoxal phosphate-dependent enzyme [Bacteroidales bacterium]|jgi:aspartate/methionine/tyrosine aminotransferase|nr:aminotransferase class I/II-fold pyridoxal phosphate-dependent enzyme [Bacteroidales bacterium]MDD2571204.1 aminotransferase class I/II-fold pyridoxal phosphate-dependent enzyme [Bacteroidales bacterium]MDD2813225.1 aminotransferase class I/II-fold pyridoxal phosphate-dependent enzyme [Bacteroidales bacterium]MDD3386089.1 aminotransferase class I/II-fold pyridoxal phosphate-dependent enzyme [Bacteroidales bacterium]MDD3811119.1 aminotransferase class I/II-fold pyridoxal phosphate-dependent e